MTATRRSVVGIPFSRDLSLSFTRIFSGRLIIGHRKRTGHRKHHRIGFSKENNILTDCDTAGFGSETESLTNVL